MNLLFEIRPFLAIRISVTLRTLQSLLALAEDWSPMILILIVIVFVIYDMAVLRWDGILCSCEVWPTSQKQRKPNKRRKQGDGKHQRLCWIFIGRLEVVDVASLVQRKQRSCI